MWALFLAALVDPASAGGPIVWRWQTGDSKCALRQQLEGGRTIELARSAGKDGTFVSWIDPEGRAPGWKQLESVKVSLEPAGEWEVDGSLERTGPRGGREISVALPGSSTSSIARSTKIRASHASFGSIAIPIRAASDAMSALRQCEIRLMRAWGIDPGAWDALSAKPEPATPISSWFSSDDYPNREKIWKNDALVVARINVGADGAVRSCTVVNRSAPIEYQSATCRAVMRSARLRPARDAQGKPIDAPYIVQINFAAFQL